MASELAAALAKVQADIPHVAKGATADTGSYKYNYAGLEDVTAAILPLLGKHGLAFTARPTVTGGRFVLAYSLIHASGEREDGEYPLPDKGTPQQIGSHITYARRYALCAVTGVAPGGEDTDAAGAGEVRMDRPAATNGHQPPEDDPWAAAQPAKSIEPRQRSHIFALFTDLNVGEAESQRTLLGDILGREVSSRKGLSYVEAEQVIKELEQMRRQKEPAEAVAP